MGGSTFLVFPLAHARGALNSRRKNCTLALDLRSALAVFARLISDSLVRVPAVGPKLT